MARLKQCRVYKKGELAGADRRFKYVDFACLNSIQRQRLAESGAYSHSAGFPESAYAYPIDQNGRVANARRYLTWSLAKVKKFRKFRKGQNFGSPKGRKHRGWKRPSRRFRALGSCIARC